MGIQNIAVNQVSGSGASGCYSVLISDGAITGAKISSATISGGGGAGGSSGMIGAGGVGFSNGFQQAIGRGLRQVNVANYGIEETKEEKVVRFIKGDFERLTGMSFDEFCTIHEGLMDKYPEKFI